SATTGLQTRRDLYVAYLNQFRSAENGLKQVLNDQINQLYANGKPTKDQLANLQNLANGTIDGMAFLVSSQLALLPAATNTLVPRVQTALLSSSRSSLASKIDGYINSPRFNQSAQSLKAVIGRSITDYTLAARRQFLNYLNTTPINRLSVDAQTAQRIPV